MTKTKTSTNWSQNGIDGFEEMIPDLSNLAMFYLVMTSAPN